MSLCLTVSLRRRSHLKGDFSWMKHCHVFFHACMSNTITFFSCCVEPPKLAATGIYSLQRRSGKRLYRDGWFSLSFHNGTEWQQIAANIAV